MLKESPVCVTGPDSAAEASVLCSSSALDVAAVFCLSSFPLPASWGAVQTPPLAALQPGIMRQSSLKGEGSRYPSEGQLLRRQEDGKLPNVSHPVYIFFQEKCQPLQQWNLIGAVGSSLFLIQLNARRCSARCLLDSNFLSSLCDSGN